MRFDVRTLEADDLDEVLTVQASCYREDLLESRECFIQKILISPSGCLGAFVARRLAAYVFTHPWQEGAPVHLDSRSLSSPLRIDCIYIPDMGVIPRARGHGIVDALLRGVQTTADARSLDLFALVAVQNSEAFWERRGFLRVRSMQYGDGSAHYMRSRSR
jgi:ribosomal protein S18 acetylase RimI-like enzyme